MQLLQPLKKELEDNYELATATEELIESERDMLQGDSSKRIMLFTLSTDVWNSVLNAGTLQTFGEDADNIAAAYRHINHLNTIINTFNKHGNQTMFTPIGKTTADQYNRSNLLNILKKTSNNVSRYIREAQDVVATLVKTECPVCETRFPSRKAMKSHVTQKTDPEHQAYKEKIH